MEAKNNKVYLRHILEEINRIETFLGEFSKEDFVIDALILPTYTNLNPSPKIYEKT